MKITLCGSTRFRNEFEWWNGKLTLAGHLVYSLGVFGKQAGDDEKTDHVVYTDEQKQTLDLVHLNKILNSDAIVVLNLNDYIGFSTKREIEWAQMQNKPIYYLCTTQNDGRTALRSLHSSAPIPIYRGDF